MRPVRKRLAAGLGLVVVLLALFLIVAVGCSSLSKERLEEELLALPKNAPVKALGLSRVTLPLEDEEGGAGAGEAEFVFVHARSRSSAGGERPPLVLVHGTPGSLFGWSEVALGAPARGAQAVVRGLAEDFDVWLLDLVGHGVTPEQDGPMTFQRGADWIGAFLAGMDLHDVSLVGHSYGGELAWRAAIDHGDRIGRLVLVDAAGIPREDDEWLSEEVAMREMALAPWGFVLNSRARLEPALQLHFQRPLEDERVVEMTRLLDNAANWRAMVDLARDENGTRVEELARIEQPTLLLWGAEDHAYALERFAREFERRIPRVELIALEGLGHYPHEEDPAAFVEALRAWLLAAG